MVIDLSREISIQAASDPSAAGAGVFGIGLLYLPRPEGAKVLQAGDVLLSALVSSAWGLFLNSEDTPGVTGGRFSQGLVTDHDPGPSATPLARVGMTPQVFPYEPRSHENPALVRRDCEE